MRKKTDLIPRFESHLESQASEKLRKEAFDYIARGAGVEATMQENLHAFDKWKIRPRVLRDVSKIDFSVSLFDQLIQTPLLLAPIGVQRIVHPDGELATAKVAGTFAIPYVVSSAASYSMEEIAQVLDNNTRWFQLYCSLEDSVTESLIKRAEASGYSAIVVTVDTPVLGVRKADQHNNYSPLFEGNGCGNYISDPAFCQLLEKSPSEDQKAAFQKQIDIIDRPGLHWDELQKIRSYTKLPILLKGILHPDDAQLALEHGIDGIIVSNHGGRQLDHCISSLDALPDICHVVKGRIPVLLDSGIRSGVDVFKALALGADAILLGRPYIYGLAVDGEAGVQQVIEEILHELEVSMALAGARTIHEINEQLLIKV
ncbi:alpha-hydroxy acid oxidase [Sporosarcina beigongshangi]|uniref:alpha-hydroxy acid oxidase n=1 Tax=Sporosarcina beigongshangi TaxID=2782538 RepID=UPI00193A1BD2|nr:alpha-hydroxy acid oxidase [Sporosarcina beigongshangi]